MLTIRCGPLHLLWFNLNVAFLASKVEYSWHRPFTIVTITKWLACCSTPKCDKATRIIWWKYTNSKATTQSWCPCIYKAQPILTQNDTFVHSTFPPNSKLTKSNPPTEPHITIYPRILTYIPSNVYAMSTPNVPWLVLSRPSTRWRLNPPRDTCDAQCTHQRSPPVWLHLFAWRRPLSSFANPL